MGPYLVVYRRKTGQQNESASLRLHLGRPTAFTSCPALLLPYVPAVTIGRSGDSRFKHNFPPGLTILDATRGHLPGTRPQPMNPHFDTSCTVIGQPEGTILKSGSRVRLEEVEAMNTARGIGLPVPAVHNVCVSPENNVEFLMDLMPGENLEVVWKGMTADEKEDIAQQLRQMISLLRSISQDQVRIGACGGQARDCRRCLEYSGGPFATEADFNNFILDLYKATPIPIRQAIHGSLGIDHRIMFTHADLSPRNIIVSNGRITGLLDWEFSGWYPEYWEYVKFFQCVTDCKDWKNFAGTIFEIQYPKELVSHQALVRWQRP